MADEAWVDIGVAGGAVASSPLQHVTAGNRELAVSFKDGRFGVVSNACNHAGGPLGEGRLDGDYITCPWHNWKFHRCSGKGEPGFEEDARPRLSGEGRERPRARRHGVADANARASPHDPHPLARKIERASGPLRLAGIATSAMDGANPRFSGSDHLLRHALERRRRARRRDAG